MRITACPFACFAAGLVVLLDWAVCAPLPASAQVLQHPDPTLDSIFPAGGQMGQTVAMELRGLGGLAGATGLVIDSPPASPRRKCALLGQRHPAGRPGPCSALIRLTVLPAK